MSAGGIGLYARAQRRIAAVGGHDAWSWLGEISGETSSEVVGVWTIRRHVDDAAAQPRVFVHGGKTWTDRKRHHRVYRLVTRDFLPITRNNSHGHGAGGLPLCLTLL